MSNGDVRRLLGTHVRAASALASSSRCSLRRGSRGRAIADGSSRAAQAGSGGSRGSSRSPRGSALGGGPPRVDRASNSLRILRGLALGGSLEPKWKFSIPPGAHALGRPDEPKANPFCLQRRRMLHFLMRKDASALFRLIRSKDLGEVRFPARSLLLAAHSQRQGVSHAFAPSQSLQKPVPVHSEASVSHCPNPHSRHAHRLGRFLHDVHSPFFCDGSATHSQKHGIPCSAATSQS